MKIGDLVELSSRAKKTRYLSVFRNKVGIVVDIIPQQPDYVYEVKWGDVEKSSFFIRHTLKKVKSEKRV
jgi:hypothetical protein